MHHSKKGSSFKQTTSNGWSVYNQEREREREGEKERRREGEERDQRPSV